MSLFFTGCTKLGQQNIITIRNLMGALKKDISKSISIAA